MSVTEISKKIRKGEVKSRDIVDACIERINEVNPILNAIVQDRFEDAQIDADKADEFLATTTKSAGEIEKEFPLLGVPFTVKESCGLKGMSQSVGCLLLKGKIAEDDGAAVKLLRKAGAIPLAVTNTSELCSFWETGNKLTGQTRNPYDYCRTSAGSSGGEGAIIGAGASLFGIASDLGGSIRIPAMFTGIYGYKPSPGLIDIEGNYPMSRIDDNFKKMFTIGPMTRFAEDLPLLIKLLSDEKAITLNLDSEVDISQLNVYFMIHYNISSVFQQVSAEIKEKLLDATSYLNLTHKCKIQNVTFDEISESVAIVSCLLPAMKGLPKLLDLLEAKKRKNISPFLELVKSYFGFSELSFIGAITLVLYHIYPYIFPKSKQEKYIEINEILKQKIEEILKDNGILLFPTFTGPALYINEIITTTSGPFLSGIINTLQLPAIHVPTGLNRKGLPIGFQVIAGQNQDRLCLAVAKDLEKYFGGWVPPPMN